MTDSHLCLILFYGHIEIIPLFGLLRRQYNKPHDTDMDGFNIKAPSCLAACSTLSFEEANRSTWDFALPIAYVPSYDAYGIDRSTENLSAESMKTNAYNYYLPGSDTLVHHVRNAPGFGSQMNFSLRTSDPADQSVSASFSSSSDSLQSMDALWWRSAMWNSVLLPFTREFEQTEHYVAHIDSLIRDGKRDHERQRRRNPEIGDYKYSDFIVRLITMMREQGPWYIQSRLMHDVETNPGPERRGSIEYDDPNFDGYSNHGHYMLAIKLAEIDRGFGKNERYYRSKFRKVMSDLMMKRRSAMYYSDLYLRYGLDPQLVRGYIINLCGWMACIGLMHDVELNPGPKIFKIPHDAVMSRIVDYKDFPLMRENFLVNLSEMMPADRFDLFMDIYKSADKSPFTSYCKCQVCLYRQEPSRRKDAYEPSYITHVFQAYMVYSHIEKVTSSYTIYTEHTLRVLVALLLDHGLFYTVPKSTEELVGEARMDYIGKMFTGGDNFSSLLRQTEEAKLEMRALREEGVKMPDLADAAATMQQINSDGINIPSVDRLSDVLQDGIKIDTGVFGAFFEKLGKFIDPMLEKAKTLKEEVGKVINVNSSGTKLFAMVAIELLRLKMERSNKYYNLLALANVVIAYQSNCPALQAFATGYYGVQGIMSIYSYIVKYLREEDEDEEMGIAMSDASYDELSKTYISSMFSILTDIKDVVTVKNAIYTFGLYKAFSTGAKFTIDSLAEIVYSMNAWLGGNTGIKFFRSVYAKYPEIYTIQETLFKIKDSVTKNEPFKHEYKATFMNTLDDIRRLQKRVVIKHGEQIYITMVNELDKLWHVMHVMLKTKGLIGETLVEAAFCIGIIGVPHCAKAQIAATITDILIKQNYSPEFYKDWCANPGRYSYQWKFFQKFADSYNSETKFVTVDDLGSCKKSTSPETCQYLWWISKVNNVPDKVDKSAVGDKDVVNFTPDIITWTSNNNCLDEADMWAKTPEAVYRRQVNGCGYAWHVDVKKEYRDDIVVEGAQKGAKNPWGYRVKREATMFSSLNTDVFDMVAYDMESKRAVKRFTWSEWATHLDYLYKRHRAHQADIITNNVNLGSNPKYNPFLPLEGVAKMEEVKKHEDDKKATTPVPMGGTVFQSFATNLLSKDFGHKYDPPTTLFELMKMDIDKLSENDLREFLKQQQIVKTNLLVEPMKEVSSYANLDEYVDALWAHTSSKMNAMETIGFDDFVNWGSGLVWGTLGDEKWAEFARENYKFMKPVYRGLAAEYLGGSVTGNFVMRFVNSTSLFTCERSIKGFYYMCIDLKLKFDRLLKVFSLTLKELWILFNKADLTAVSIAKGTFSIIVRMCSGVYVTAAEAGYTTFHSITHFQNVWVNMFVAGIAGLVVTAKATNAIAHAEYTRMGKVLHNPLKKKCRTSALIKEKCPCIDCAKLRETEAARIKSIGESRSQLSPAALANVKDQALSVAKRNVFNASLHIPMKYPAAVLLNNSLAVCSQLVMFPNHFIRACIDEMNKTNCAVLMMLTNYKGTRSFSINFRDMRFVHLPDVDLSMWLNDGYSSFGGGIRNIISFFPYIDEKSPTIGMQYLLRYNSTTRELKHSITDAVHINKSLVAYAAKIGDEGAIYRMEAYTINTPSEVGHCGCPLFSADTVMTEQRIIGFLVGGDKDDGRTFVTKIYRGMLEDVIRKHNIQVFDTSDLPTEVVETDLIPEGFACCEIRKDTHNMPTLNNIERTELHGIYGETNKIPCFISPWVRDDDGVIVDVHAKMRAKYVTNGSPVSEVLLKMAVSMMVKDAEAAIPPSEERHYTLTTLEAINGAKGESPLSTKTSAGAKYLLQGVTKKMLVKRNADELDLSSEWGQQLIRDIEYKTECYNTGKIPLNYANEFPKVECLPAEKVYEGKCRCVCGADCDTCIADKKEFAWLNRLLKSRGFDMGLLVGSNPNDMSSHIMVLAMLIWNKIRDGDFSGYDTTFMRWLYGAVRDFVLALVPDAPEKSKLAIKTITESMMFIVHVAHVRFNSKTGEHVEFAVFYEWFHGMISGSFLTLLFNTIGNGILFRYVYLCAYVTEELAVDYLCYDPSLHGMLDIEYLRNQILHYCTGDDSLHVVSPSIPWYTGNIMTEIFIRHGIKYTTSAKDGAFEDKSIVRYGEEPANFSFCKRTIYWCEEYKRYVWILDWDSMIGSLYHSENFREKEQVINEFFKQLALRGRTEFQSKGPVLSSATRRFYNYVSPFETYEVALAAAVGEIDEKLAVRINKAIDSGKLTSEDVLDLKSKVRLALFLKDHELCPSVRNSGDIIPSATEDNLINNDLLLENEPLLETDVESQEVVMNNKIEEVNLDVFELEEAVRGIALMERNDGTTKMLDVSEVEEVVGYVEPTEDFSHVYTDMKSFFMRPMQVTKQVLVEATAPGTDIIAYNIGPLLTGNSTWMDKASGFLGCRGTAVVTLQINATNMQKGSWLLHYIPNFTSNPTADSLNVTLMQKSQHPGILFTTKDSSVSLKIPYIAPVSYYQLDTGDYDWGRFFLTNVTSLRNGPNAVSMTVDVTVWLHFEDMELMVPTSVAMSETVAMASMPVSVALRKTAKIVSRFGDVPMLSAYTKPTAWALNAAAGLASTFGHSKPLVNPAMEYVAIRGANYMAVGDGPDVSVSASLTSQNQTRYISKMTPRTEDEMSFAFLKQIWSYAGQFTMSTGDVTGSNLYNMPVGPLSFFANSSHTVSGHTLQYTTYPPFAHITKMFSAWRGSLEWKITPVKTVETGRLRLQFWPDNDASTGSVGDMTSMSIILDLEKDSEITFTLPWLVKSSWKGIDETFGTLGITVLNELKTPETVSPVVDFIIHVRAGPDYEVAGAVGSIGNCAARAEKVIFGDQKVAGPTTRYCEESMGETFLSVKQILMRRYIMKAKTVPTAWGIIINPDYIESVAMDGAGLLISPNYGGTLHPLIMAMYMYRRGSCSAQAATGYAYLVGKPATVYSTAVTDEQPYTASNWTLLNTNVAAPATLSNDMPLRLPYYCDTPFTINRLQKDDNAYLNPDETFVAAKFYGSSASSKQYVFRNYGDDFQLGFFICTPLVLTGYS